MRKKILVIDDEEAIRLTLEAMLEDDYTVECAESGEEGLQKLPVFRPDLIIIDVDMPGMSGLETCRRIRADDKFKYTKMLFLSGKVTLADRMKAYEAGADDYIKKPFDEGELKSKVRVFMRLKNVEELSRLKNDFLQLMAHEIKSPLNAIFLPAKMFMENETLSREETLELVESIHKSALWLHENFKKIMLLLRLKSGKQLTPMFGLIKEYLSIALQKQQEKISQKELKVNLDIPDDAGLEADWEILSITLANILDNAVKFSSQGGTIDIRATRENERMKLCISDQGKGIKKEQLENIFNEFCIHDIMYHQRGMGISMVIAKLAMEEHGGSIKVESEEDKGTLVTLEMPSFTLNLEEPE